VRVAGPSCLIVIENMLLLSTAGPLMNGIVDYNFGLPWSGLASPASLEFLKEYQAGAGAQGIDALGAAVCVCLHAGAATGGPGGAELGR
jgi:hypothetical protein